jgi:hypothetical protein
MGPGFGEVASGEWRVTSLKKEQVPADKTRDSRRLECARRFADLSGAQKARVWGRAGSGSRSCL